MSTLADLLVPKTRDAREAQLLGALNGAGFPVTDWFVGSVARTILKMISAGLVDFDSLVPQIAAGGFVGPFLTGGKTYPTRSWLELVAAELFGLTPAPATTCRQRINLWCTVGAGPYAISPGDLIATNPHSADRYTNVTGGTVAGGTSPPTKIALDFDAESPGALFNRDIAGTISQLVTPKPGLLIANEPLHFGGLNSSGRAARNGTGTGTLTPQDTVGGVAPTGNVNYTLTVTVAGQISPGTASGTLTVDDGSTQVIISLAPLPASYAVAGRGVTLAFANGAQNPSFVAGDIYTFSTPGSPIINPGTDPESDDSLRARMRGRWPALSAIPTEDRYAAWIRQASIDNGYGITKIATRASVVIAGQTDVTVATDAGAVPGGVVAALQTYVDARDGITDKANVQSASTLPITTAGTVTIRTASSAVVKAQALANWQAYLAALQIGGDTPGGVVRLAALERAIMDAGAVDVSGLQLNGAGANVSISTAQVATASVSLDGNGLWADLTWLEVP